MPQDRAQRPLPARRPRRAAAIRRRRGTQPAPFAGGTYFLGRYRVVDEIGVGGMASVHLARMDGPGGFQKWVAIKRIHPHLVEDETFVNMFLDEARVAARISHPNVATVFELGKHEDTYWIAMEYLHGEPLREVMRRTEELGQPMPPEIACRVIADAAEGLHAAHELLGKNGEKLGLVHRDVTPHNLFVTYDGSTKVVDFGIAKFSSRMANTRAGTLKGKLAYMSPEQVAGRAHRPPHRRLRARRRALGADDRAAPLPDGERPRHPRQGPGVQRPAPEHDRARLPDRPREDRDEGAREDEERALPHLARVLAGAPVAAHAPRASSSRATRSPRTWCRSSATASRSARRTCAGRRRSRRRVDIDKMKGLPASPVADRGRLDPHVQLGGAGLAAEHGAGPRRDPRPGAPARQERPPSAPSADGASTRREEHAPPRRPGHRARPAAAPVPRAARSAAARRPAALRGPAHPRAPARRRTPGPRQPASFDDDFDDVGDTIVSDSMPEMEELRRQAPDARPRAVPAPLGITQSRRRRLPWPWPSPPARARPSPPARRRRRCRRSSCLPHAHRRPLGTCRAPPPWPSRTWPSRSRSLRPSMSNEYAAPAGHPATLAMEAHGPADMQRLFAPPASQRAAHDHGAVAEASHPGLGGRRRLGRHRPRGLRARRRCSLDRSHEPRATSSARRRQGAPRAPATAAHRPVAAASRAGPFASARAAFEADDRARPGPGADERQRRPAAGSPRPHLRPRLRPLRRPIPTTNIASLPAGSTRPSPAVAHAAPAAREPPPSTSGGGSGTLKVICFPGCDQVIDNGSALGPSPIIRRSATVGSHRIKLVWSDASKVVSTVVIADQTATVRENHP